MRPVVIVSLLFGLSLSAAQAAERTKTFTPRKVLPVDEASKDPSFQAFRDELIKAIERKDGNFLLSVVDPHIAISFGGDDGIEFFRRNWKPEDPNSAIWSQLGEILRMGGTFGMNGGAKDQFWAPYLFTRFPQKYDVFDYIAIIAKDVKVREAANDSAPAVATLSYDVVRTLQNEGSKEWTPKPGSEWIPIRLADGREGYVQDRFVRSPIDYRACFKNTAGRWVMTVFIAGD
jgi:hypothetical protein